jgi:probable rRNA maturation factor
MIRVEIIEDFDLPIATQLIVGAAEATLRHQEIPKDSSLMVVVMGEEGIQQLNHQYLGLDAPTDVLSFQAGYLDPEDKSTYLGDVILSAPQAQSQAESRGHSFADEVQLLVIHGTLHLLGHDHAEAQEKARMWAAQAAILEQLGIPARVLDEAEAPSTDA